MRLRPRGASELRTTTVQDARWPGDILLIYLSILLVTAILKWSLLAAVYADELPAGLELSGRSIPGASLGVIRTLTSDAWQLLPVAIAIFLAGRVLLGARLRWTIFVPVAAMVAMGALSWLSYRELGIPLSLHVLWLATSWMGSHFQTFVALLLRPRPILAIAALLLLSIAAVGVLVKSRSRSVNVRARTALLVLAALWIPAAAYAIERNDRADSVATRGYWSTTLSWFLSGAPGDPYGDSPDTLDQLRSDYREVAFSGGRTLSPAEPSVTKRVRYVTLIVMETAPARFYNLSDNPALPAFWRMSQHGIVSPRHYSTMPYTAESIYSIVSGMYPVHRIYRLASRASPRLSLVGALRAAGFETTFIDSFDIDWSPGNRMGDMWRGLGFDALETGRSPRRRGVRSASPEITSFELASSSIDSARAGGRGAFIVIATALGHFPWTSTKIGGAAAAVGAMASTAAAIDSLTGALIAKLDRDGILDESLVIVTGDHGLRFREEFTSLGLAPTDMELTFNVPFILFAPGVVTEPRRLGLPTSHIDIAPTIAALTGISTDPLLLHGASLLSGAPGDRTLFGMATGLSPSDYVIRGIERYVMNHLTGEVRFLWDGGAPVSPTAKPLSADSVRLTLSAAQKVIGRSAAFQLRGIGKTQ